MAVIKRKINAVKLIKNDVLYYCDGLRVIYPNEPYLVKLQVKEINWDNRNGEMARIDVVSIITFDDTEILIDMGHCILERIIVQVTP